jgi:hypothetical protein
MDENKKYFTVGRILGDTINFYTENFLKLWLPYILVSVPVGFFVEYINLKMPVTFVNFSLIFFNSLLGVGIGLYVLINGLSLYNNRASSRSVVMSKVKKIFFPYLLLQILIFLGVMGGMFLLIVPGVIFSLRWAVASVAFLEEDLEIRQSMKRSGGLVKGYKGQILISYALIVIIGMTLYAMTTRMTGNYTGIIDSISRRSQNPLNFSSMVYSLLSSFVAPLYPSLSVVIYFNLKKEKEAYMTEKLADSFLENDDSAGE